MGVRLLVCGGRDYKDAPTVYYTLNMQRRLNFGTIACLIHGGAKGADEMAGYWAERNEIPVKVYPAEWAKHGKKAGPVRNQLMIDDGKPEYVIAFPGGRGTADMVRRAKAAGIPVHEVSAGPVQQSFVENAHD